jgi:hypothetical protein
VGSRTYPDPNCDTDPNTETHASPDYAAQARSDPSTNGDSGAYARSDPSTNGRAGASHPRHRLWRDTFIRNSTDRVVARNQFR